MNISVNDLCVIMSTVENFGDWLLNELKQAGISQSEFARRAGLSKGTISNLINGTKGVGQDSLVAIAKTLHVPTEFVFEKAGLLPPKPKRDSILEQIEHLYNSLRDPGNQQRALDYMELLQAQEERKGSTYAVNEKNTEPKPR